MKGMGKMEEMNKAEKIITQDQLEKFQRELRENEKAPFTIKKYLRNMRKLKDYAEGREITKDLMIDYKNHLKKAGYKVRSINSFLTAANAFFDFAGWPELKIKLLTMQQQTFLEEEKELTMGEYKRLVSAAKKQKKYRLALILIILCSTGIRVGELKFLTAESVRLGRMTVFNKGKSRVVLFTDDLCKQLRLYMIQTHITTGVIIRTSGGKPEDRSNIWREMKQLCKYAGVEESKVFPHNFRHLFARIFYKIDKDMVKLADMLGHGSIETTRIYLRCGMKNCLENLKATGLVLDLYDKSPETT